MDDIDTIVRKCKRAVTDSDSEVRYSGDKPGVSNLLEIYSTCLGKTIEEAEKDFVGVGYGDFKMAVAEAVISVLKPLQEEYNRLLQEKDYIDRMIKENDEKAAYFANKTLRKVKKKLGLTEIPR
jgi:tryptophanyl-tRNA synthetase